MAGSDNDTRKYWKVFLNKGFLMNIQNIMLLSVILSASCLMSCAYPPAASLDAPKEISGSKAYLINPGTTIGLSIYGEDTLTGSFLVDHNGDLTLPMLGEFHANAQTQSELREAVASRLKEKGYISNPVVSLSILSPRPIYILGEVRTPGEYPYKPDMDVFEAISIAGGYTPRASQGDVLISRRVSEEKVKYNAEENTKVLPGDSITVRERIF